MSEDYINKNIKNIDELLKMVQERSKVSKSYILRNLEIKPKIHINKIDGIKVNINRYDLASYRVFDIFNNVRQLILSLNGIYNYTNKIGLMEEDYFPINFLGHQCIELCKKSLVLYDDHSNIFDVYNDNINNIKKQTSGITSHYISKIKLPKSNLSIILKTIEKELNGLDSTYFNYRYRNVKELSSSGVVGLDGKITKFSGIAFINLINLYYMISLFIMKDYVIAFMEDKVNTKTNLYDLKVLETSIKCNIGSFNIDSSLRDIEELSNNIDQYINERCDKIRVMTLKKRKLNKSNNLFDKRINKYTLEVENLEFIKNILNKSIEMNKVIKVKKNCKYNHCKVNNEKDNEIYYKKVRKAWILRGAYRRIEKLIYDYECNKESLFDYSISDEYKREIYLKSYKELDIEKYSIYKSGHYFLTKYENEIKTILNKKIKIYDELEKEYLEYIKIFASNIIKSICEVCDVKDEKIALKKGLLDTKMIYLSKLIDKKPL